MDDAATTELHRNILRSKPFMRRLYMDYYREFAAAVGEDSENKVFVELGSGGGFIKEVMPNVITSDVLKLTYVDKVFSALEMPFDNDSVDAFFMINVVHHISDSKAFFAEALRCLKPGGKIIMIEPANTAWSRFIFKHFHHEAFDPQGQWGLDRSAPLSCANDALVWIIFWRDREIFEKQFPEFQINRRENHTPFRYLLSGGFTLRQLAPSFTYGLIKMLELALRPMRDCIGMFQTIELTKIKK
jgi:SAM-dependent methyltransferase